MLRVVFWVLTTMSLCQPADAHRWLMRVAKRPDNVSIGECESQLAIVADNINATLKKKGLDPGKIIVVGNAVRVDAAGADDVGVYLFCSENNVYVFAAHGPDGDSPVFQALWEAFVRQVDLIKKANNAPN
jgi:hypothetical protein